MLMRFKSWETLLNLFFQPLLCDVSWFTTATSISANYTPFATLTLHFCTRVNTHLRQPSWILSVSSRISKEFQGKRNSEMSRSDWSRAVDRDAHWPSTSLLCSKGMKKGRVLWSTNVKFFHAVKKPTHGC